MGDTAKSYLGGLRDGSGQLDAYWYQTDVGHDDLLSNFAAGTTVTLNLYPEGNTTSKAVYSGDVVIKQVSISGSKDDIITISFQFRGFLAKDTVT